ncbi:heterokaryon incompatibility protein-domain-containing protein [Pyrenochaeta sp. MPI-SDFR-AT-0127]|nr:heterokaryon incompatibility protein-domain-containing protein [Pyrenochaeta sp. MPI-SDFR-AT-0127]
MSSPKNASTRPVPLRSHASRTYPSIEFHCEPHTYEPLQTSKHIRLLRLAPGELCSPLYCTLEQVNLDDRPWFQALSYAWGDANDVFKMKCDDKEISITRNLYEALDKFRDLEAERLLWVDAICINQKDVLERGAQVQLMARIYSEADRVLLWLGRQYQDLVDAALAYLGIFRNAQEVGEEERHRREKMLGLKRSFTDLDGGTEKALLALYCCPVFRRGWVIQEVALAKSVSVCWGYARFDFSALIKVVLENQVVLGKLAMENDMSNEYTCIYDMCMIRSQQQAGVTIHPLFLIQRVRPFLFSDERDRIYGILALRISANENPEEGSFVEPDYTVYIGDAFIKFTKACLIRLSDLRTLLYVCHRDNTPQEWPSWAPLWNDLNPHWWPLREDYTCGSERFDVIKNSGTAQEYVSIRGILVTGVDAVLGSISPSDSDQEAQSFLRTLRDSFDPVQVAETGMALNAYNFPLDQLAKRSGKDCSSLRIAGCQQYLDLDLSKHPFSKHVPSHVEESELGNFYGILYRRRLESQIFFRTSQGVLGVGPSNLQEGDSVVILFSQSGPNLSFVLRPAGDFWKLLGPCYVYAFKDGSAVQRWKDSGESAKTFNIS